MGEIRYGPQTPARIAGNMFIEVSMITPASVTGQAAGIAERCKILELDPQLLKESLLSDQREVERICNVATAAHKKSSAPSMVSEIDALRFIQASFYKAEQLILYPVTSLKIIQLDFYQYSKRMSKATGETIEYFMRSRLRDL